MHHTSPHDRQQVAQPINQSQQPPRKVAGRQDHQSPQDACFEKRSKRSSALRSAPTAFQQRLGEFAARVNNVPQRENPNGSDSRRRRHNGLTIEKGCVGTGWYPGTAASPARTSRNPYSLPVVQSDCQRPTQLVGDKLAAGSHSLPRFAAASRLSGKSTGMYFIRTRRPLRRVRANLRLLEAW